MGYDPDLIQNVEESEKFMCTICFEISELPKKCSRCSKIFCGKCIHEWMNVRKQCPFKCSEIDIMPIELDSEDIYKYQKIKIRCDKRCSNIITLGNLNEHLSVCGLENCSNHSICKKFGKFIIKGQKYCSEFCFEFIKIKSQKEKDKFKIFKLIKKYKLTKNKIKIKFFDPESDHIEEGYELEE